jgi:uncharacterized repeat protein (TIGR02543 family)
VRREPLRRKPIAYLGFVTEPTEPVRIGYDFEHWATTINGTIAWNFASDTVTSDLTLFAIWIETEVQDRVFYVDIPEYWKIDGGTVAAYAWEGESHNFEWPGIKMNNVAGDVYAYTLPEQYTNFIFVRVSQTSDARLECPDRRLKYHASRKQ